MPPGAPYITAAIVDQPSCTRRRSAAIHCAALELEQNPYIERDGYGGLIIGSPSGRVYSANGVCQFEVFTYGNACWHRAAAWLVVRHDQRQAKAEIDADTLARWRKAQAEMDSLFV